MTKERMDAEKLIALVHSKPELWDQNHKLYSSRDVKFRIWQQLGHELGVTGSAAKLKWTCLRDTFRREVKKTYQQTTDDNGTPQEPYVPKWTHFKSMLFLKEMMVRDGHNHPTQQQPTTPATPGHNSDTPQRSHFLEPFLNDQATTKSSLDDDNTSYEDDAFDDDVAPSTSKQRRLTATATTKTLNSLPYGTDVHGIKRTMSEYNYSDDGTMEKESRRTDRKRSVAEIDEDYHFLQSILPSVRKIHSSRKTLFKMKLLQLIYEEETFSATGSSNNTTVEASSPSTTQVKEEFSK